MKTCAALALGMVVGALLATVTGGAVLYRVALQFASQF